MSTHLIVGLGNPGRRYAATRHNVGWRVVDEFARRYSITWKTQNRFRADVATAKSESATVHLVKPLTYMNDSGVSVGLLQRYLNISTDRIIVVFDEINLPVDRIKVSLKGSHGGHNGIASVIQHCGNDFTRLRVGVSGRPSQTIDLRDWVLSCFSANEALTLATTIPLAADALDMILFDGVDNAMNQFNRRPTPIEPTPSKPENEPDNPVTAQISRDLHP